jgi:hypothetical protein
MVDRSQVLPESFVGLFFVEDIQHPITLAMGVCGFPCSSGIAGEVCAAEPLLGTEVWLANALIQICYLLDYHLVDVLLLSLFLKRRNPQRQPHWFSSVHWVSTIASG